MSDNRREPVQAVMLEGASDDAIREWLEYAAGTRIDNVCPYCGGSVELVKVNKMFALRAEHDPEVCPVVDGDEEAAVVFGDLVAAVIEGLAAADLRRARG